MPSGKLVFRLRILPCIGLALTSTTLFYWWFSGFESQERNSAVALAPLALQKKVDVPYPPVIKRYCNYPLFNATDGNAWDGAGRTNLVLRGLVVITRHGDRAPLLPFPQHLRTPQCGLWNAEDVDLFHRYRLDLAKTGAGGLPLHDDASSTFRSFLTSPPDERCRPSHLTAIGAVQLIRLGRYLRDHYRKAWAFPTADTECSARSTVYPRTYQSALAFLYGWTGGVGGKNQGCQLRSTQTTYFCSDDWCLCPNRIDAYRREYHQRLASYTRTETKDVGVRAIVQEIGAILRTTSDDPVSAFDSLMGYACHQAALPCAARASTESRITEKSNCATKEWLVRLHNEAKGAGVAAMKEESGRKLASVEAAPILVALSTLADKLISTRKSIFEYYSGHDVTLRPLLSVLGAWDGSIPPYASRLIFEFVEDPAKEGSLYFRVLYNGYDVTQRITSSICSDPVLTRYNEVVFTLCNIDGLKNYAKKFVNVLRNGEKQFGDEWVRLCR